MTKEAYTYDNSTLQAQKLRVEQLKKVIVQLFTDQDDTPKKPEKTLDLEGRAIIKKPKKDKS